MIKIDARVDVRGIINQLAHAKDKHKPFATSLAINKTAQLVKKEQQEEIKKVFDNPTNYIINSLFIRPSNKQNLTARVWLKDRATSGNPANKILNAEIAGGQRRLKAYEKALRAAGALPAGYYTVPGEAAPINANGNIPGPFIVKLLSYFKAFPEDGYKRNSTEESREKLKKGTKKKQGISYFVGAPPPGHQLGIWERGHASKMAGPVRPLRPILMFMPSTNYKKAYDFEHVAKTTIDRNFDNEFKKAWAIAKSTAK